ncbi:unnamed protein product [Leptidea sinapis]|uniref:BESS domain-containing protein n=1 Tax=Leptidea sinapis TaxID=189913 RepID=A0A5E4R3E0_9NEOP|nr:unnamed protein product [Leptidea sinapis]
MNKLVRKFDPLVTCFVPTCNNTISEPNSQNTERDEQTGENENKDPRAEAGIRKEKDKQTDSEQSYQTSFKTRLNKLSSVVRNMQTLAETLHHEEQENEFHIYGKYVGMQLMSMTEEDAILAQQEIQSILTKYKLKKVKRNVSQTSTSSSQLSDYQSLVLPTEGPTSVCPNSPSSLPDHSPFRYQPPSPQQSFMPFPSPLIPHQLPTVKILSSQLIRAPNQSQVQYDSDNQTIMTSDSPRSNETPVLMNTNQSAFEEDAEEAYTAAKFITNYSSF